MRRLIFFAFILVCIGACKTEKKPAEDFNSFAENYVRLGLTIGQYDRGFC